MFGWISPRFRELLPLTRVPKGKLICGTGNCSVSAQFPHQSITRMPALVDCMLRFLECTFTKQDFSGDIASTSQTLDTSFDGGRQELVTAVIVDTILSEPSAFPESTLSSAPFNALRIMPLGDSYIPVERMMARQISMRL